MDFSIVVPLYNKAPHVADAINSIFSQSLAPREIIVVDDGSTDGGDDIVRAIEDPRLILLSRSPPGPGGYAARNHGIRHASGEWIAFLDADDRWHESHLSDLAAAVERCAEPVGCAFSRFEIKQSGRDRPHPVDESVLVPGKALDLATILKAWIAQKACPLWTGATAFRRQVLIDAGLFPEGRTRRGGDKDMWLRAVAHARTAYAPQISAEFHQETVNRMSLSTAHTQLPILVETIATLLETATDEERKLLRMLSNQEVRHYARYATGARAKSGTDFLRSIYLPEGGVDFTWVAAYMAAQRLLPKRRQAAKPR
ncbi:glycosyltransferase family 2 protein [Sphingomonas sp. 37zxx]|uniref:glycosyltransferase family 2 protein n=1 Tax=Sphingomonas sp. 37zxx TaxID=1550073 RepID=UPI000691D529|nr:glycosyltransferase family A protein [Sphingomonas sp. 37zxx]